jgi:hypothetical protein
MTFAARDFWRGRGASDKNTLGRLVKRQLPMPGGTLSPTSLIGSAELRPNGWRGRGAGEEKVGPIIFRKRVAKKKSETPTTNAGRDVVPNVPDHFVGIAVRTVGAHTAQGGEGRPDHFS